VDGLALYGAIVATVALGWQVYSWGRDRTTRVEVKVSVALTLPNVGQVVLISAINHSRHAIRINSAGLEAQDGSGNWLIQPVPPNGASIPGTVQPHDQAQTYFLWDEFMRAGLDPRKPVIARVNAADGHEFRSKRRPIFKK
jgi:hypothetical protein